MPGAHRRGGSGWKRGFLFAAIGFFLVLVATPFIISAIQSGRIENDARAGTYPLDTTIARTPAWEVRISRMQVTRRNVTLTVRYSNISSTPQTLACDDAIGGTYIEFPDKRIPADRTLCSTRIGDSWQVGSGQTFTATARFPVTGHGGSSFTVNWFNWGETTEKITLPAS